ncbi:response regulator [Mucilaginibacter sp. KACC 22063]|uniref:response regulator n=1 Tax=Mucilaginibacter sp. KACC 22063 TaxID=3025666 RepID=UPI002365168B|nr:response regulator transcription factor [Mucilaginibacter sp. KACC 22063]WDF55378.1 response regulator transcription factor [Mucilaginibacter sp. KACC 22063]
MTNQKFQIALVDDHKLFRSGIASLINQLDNYTVLFEASNGNELITRFSNVNPPHIVVLDINMPEMDGFLTTQWLKKNAPDTRIIILSMYQDAEKVLSMVKLGVHGYLLKDSEPEEFEKALREVTNGELYYPSFVTRHLVESYSKPDINVKLNTREVEFLKLVGTEMTYKEIADKMNISVRTVDGYRDQLFEKLQVKSRVGLVIYAIKNNLMQL